MFALLGEKNDGSKIILCEQLWKKGVNKYGNKIQI
jgi:hypothetical protein